MEHLYDDKLRFNDTCVAFGTFDGLHRGHRSVIEKVAAYRTRGITSVLVSFTNEIPDTGGEGDLLYTETEKRDLLEENRPDVLLSLPLTSATAQMEAEQFIKVVLADRLGAKVVVAGERCCFGKDRRGSVDLLRKYAPVYGYEVVTCRTLRYDGEEITSARVRRALAASDLERATTLLGHPYTITGEVIHGKALGRTVGMPTANLAIPPGKYIPAHGVYATISEIEGRRVQGLTNIGFRPSVDSSNHVTVETFLIDFSDEIYGKAMRVALHAFVRGVRKFNDLDEVQRQVKLDLANTREYLRAIV